uniref:MIF4G-like type 2 domain-containing protein n=1 Tax=Chromera velia CCMP2878 TaxID=1169474 RepID=A0A0G4GIZ7_9ALVE|eukprot:Cvel_4777.t1-p1 / transcript=Cvel_4777.t1 / gene=Cvel_4777 / organism=Chromera_velia_CCMP2878 / gene_product=hypothetical protein / transcript_product=hypothetical protein / location=Cvel_scaffold213:56749-68028(+) / protein_length=1020 / sequence_SO=supercontig / SO=protein_coding / is_pseudo=false
MFRGLIANELGDSLSKWNDQVGKLLEQAPKGEFFDRFGEEFADAVVDCASAFSWRHSILATFVALYGAEAQRKNFHQWVVHTAYEKFQQFVEKGKIENASMVLRFLGDLAAVRVLNVNSFLSLLARLAEESAKLAAWEGGDLGVFLVLSALLYLDQSLHEDPEKAESITHILELCGGYLVNRQADWKPVVDISPITSAGAINGHGAAAAAAGTALWGSSQDRLETLAEAVKSLKASGWDATKMGILRLYRGEKTKANLQEIQLPELPLPLEPRLNADTFQALKWRPPVLLRPLTELQELNAEQAEYSVSPQLRWVIEDHVLNVLHGFSADHSMCIHQLLKIPVNHPHFNIILAETIFSDLMRLPEPRKPPYFYYRLLDLLLDKEKPSIPVVEKLLVGLAARVPHIDEEALMRLSSLFSAILVANDSAFAYGLFTQNPVDGRRVQRFLRHAIEKMWRTTQSEVAEKRLEGTPVEALVPERPESIPFFMGTAPPEFAQLRKKLFFKLQDFANVSEQKVAFVNRPPTLGESQYDVLEILKKMTGSPKLRYLSAEEVETANRQVDERVQVKIEEIDRMRADYLTSMQMKQEEGTVAVGGDENMGGGGEGAAGASEEPVFMGVTQGEPQPNNAQEGRRQRQKREGDAEGEEGEGGGGDEEMGDSSGAAAASGGGGQDEMKDEEVAVTGHGTVPVSEEQKKRAEQKVAAEIKTEEEKRLQKEVKRIKNEIVELDERRPTLQSTVATEIQWNGVEVLDLFCQVIITHGSRTITHSNRLLEYYGRTLADFCAWLPPNVNLQYNHFLKREPGVSEMETEVSAPPDFDVRTALEARMVTATLHFHRRNPVRVEVQINYLTNNDRIRPISAVKGLFDYLERGNLECLEEVVFWNVLSSALNSGVLPIQRLEEELTKLRAEEEPNLSEFDRERMTALPAEIERARGEMLLLTCKALKCLAKLYIEINAEAAERELILGWFKAVGRRALRHTPVERLDLERHVFGHDPEVLVQTLQPLSDALEACRLHSLTTC